MGHLARHAIFPVSMGAAALATAWGLGAGYADIVVLNVVANAFFLVVLGLERLVPYRADWNRGDGQVLNDVGHTVLGTGVGAMAGNAFVQVAFAGAALHLWPESTRGPWPTGWPLWAQVALVYLVADLGRYWQHRAMHRVSWLWRWHALHHSGERLSAWKTSRSHLGERFFQQVCMFGLLTLIGTPADVVVWYVIPNTVLGILDHSNVDARLGWLEHVVMGPASHRLHHSRDVGESDSNFGSAIVVWDRVFGTWTPPFGHPGVAAVGIEGDPLPDGFVGQYLSPFLWGRLQRSVRAREHGLGGAGAEGGAGGAGPEVERGAEGAAP